MNYNIEISGLDLQWFMQYSGFEETTALSLYTKIGPNSIWRKYLKAKHILDIQADGNRILIMCKSSERKKDFKVSWRLFHMQT